jgi:hypothetical protein
LKYTPRAGSSRSSGARTAPPRSGGGRFVRFARPAVASSRASSGDDVGDDLFARFSVDSVGVFGGDGEPSARRPVVVVARASASRRRASFAVAASTAVASRFPRARATHGVVEHRARALERRADAR